MNDDGNPRPKAEDIDAEIVSNENDFGDGEENPESLDIDALIGEDATPLKAITGEEEKEDGNDLPPDLPPGFHIEE